MTCDSRTSHDVSSRAEVCKRFYTASWKGGGGGGLRGVRGIKEGEVRGSGEREG